MEIRKLDVDAMGMIEVECACDWGDALMVRAVTIDNLEVSIWLLQTDDGEVGYTLKLKQREAFASPGRSVPNEVMKNIADALSWVMSEISDRSIRGTWAPVRSF